MSKRHCLYRFFAADGELLYVGITMNPAARWPKHSHQKPWWTEVESITLETFPSREEVLDAEREAIKTEHPRHNVVHAERITPQEPTPPANITWECPGCWGEIGDGDGSLAVSADDLNRHLGELQTWQSQIPPDQIGTSIAHLMDYPGPAEWRPSHYACQDAEPIYEIAVEDLRTPAQILAMTAHLMSKSWLESTDWDRVILSVCNRLPSEPADGR